MRIPFLLPVLLGLAAFGLVISSRGATPREADTPIAREPGTLSKGPSPLYAGAPSFFYRMKADFILKDTGEPISFDYVAGCGGVVQNYLHTTPSVIYQHSPTIMFQSVGDGHALGVVTISMCEYWKWETLKHGPKAGQSRIPGNVRPLAIWIEDVNDLSFGWGYKTDDAYDSPLAKIEFVEASLEVTDEAAWKAWREQAEADYEQVGVLPGPWGYSDLDAYLAHLTAIDAEQGYFGVVDARCTAAGWVPIKEEHLNEIFAAAPDDVGQYWLVSDAREYAPEALRALFKDDTAFGSGKSFGDFNARNDPYLGTVSRDGGGHVAPLVHSDDIPEDGYAYRDVYPLLPRSEAMPNAETPQESYRQIILKSDAYKGFGACKSGGRPIDTLDKVWPPLREHADRLGLRAFDPDGKQKHHELYVNDAPVPGQLLGAAEIFQHPDRMLDRDGYLIIKDQ